MVLVVADVMFVNGVGFLVIIHSNIRFTTVQYIRIAIYLNTYKILTKSTISAECM